MNNISRTSLWLILFLSHYGAYAATCTLDTTPSPAITSYEQNVDKVLEAIKKEWGKKSCPSGMMSPGNTKIVLSIMEGSDYDIWNFSTNNRLFLDTSDKMLLPSAKKHDDYILGIQQKILETGAEIGGRCADVVRFEENVQLGNSRYKTKNRILQEVLNDMYVQNGKVLSFYRDLASNVQNNEYLDESKFTVAPEGFSDDMREFYSPANIQQCHDEDAKKQKIQETQKEWLAEAMKYPQWVGAWKKAFELLLFGKSAQPDSPEEENPTNTAHAKTGGLWNSMALLNRLFQKMFWFLGNSEWSPDKLVAEASKKNASDTGLVQSSFPEATKSFEQASGKSSASPLDYQRQYTSAGDLNKTVNLAQNSQTNNNVTNIAPNAEKNNSLTQPLVDVIETNAKTQENLEENEEIICSVHEKQAQNLPGKETCDEIKAAGDEISGVPPGGWDDQISGEGLFPNPQWLRTPPWLYGPSWM